MSETALVPIQEVPKPVRRTKRTVNNYVDRLVAANTPEIADAMVKAIVKQLGESDVKTVQLVAQMLGLVKAPGGPTINNTNINANVNGVAAKDRNFESIIKRLEERDLGRTSDVQDADYEVIEQKGDDS